MKFFCVAFFKFLLIWIFVVRLNSRGHRGPLIVLNTFSMGLFFTKPRISVDINHLLVIKPGELQLFHVEIVFYIPSLFKILGYFLFLNHST